MRKANKGKPNRKRNGGQREAMGGNGRQRRATEDGCRKRKPVRETNKGKPKRKGNGRQREAAGGNGRQRRATENGKLKKEANKGS